MRMVVAGRLCAIGLPAVAEPVERQFERLPLTTPAIGAARFGGALALDGDTLAVGAPLTGRGSTFFVGAAYVFRREPGGVWQPEAELAPAELVGFDQFGSALALDGDTLAVAVPNARSNGVSQSGDVYLFDRNAAGGWSQTARLDDATVGFLGHFGSSMALEGDLLAVGAPARESNGLVALYERDAAGEWVRVATLRDTDVGDGGTFEAFGSSVALAGDLLVVGAGQADVSDFGANDGAAYLYHRSATDRHQWDFIQRVTAAEATLCTGGLTLAELALQPLEVRLEAQRCARENSITDNDGFAGRLALAPDRLLIGAASAEAPDGTAGAGAAYLFAPDADGVWRQAAKLDAQKPVVNGGFGTGVALLADALVVGAPGTPVDGHTGQGLAWLLTADAAGIWQPTELYRASDGLGEAAFGTAFANDNGAVLIGAPGAAGDAGAVYRQAPPPVEPPPPPPFIATAMLEDGTTVTSVEGVLLGAVEGTLSAPVPVAVRRLAVPAEPLPPDVTLVGDIHELAAESEVVAPDDLPLPVGLPVPTGTDPSTLGAIVLVTQTAAGEPAPVRDWVPTEGSYDAARGLFVVTLSGLDRGGVALALTGAAPAAPAAPASALRSAAAELFKIRCDAPARIEPAICATATPVVRDALTAAYTVFVTEQGFKEPNLRRHRGFFEGLPPVPKLEREAGFSNVQITSFPVYTVVGSRRQEAAAVYDPTTRSIRVGVDTIITDQVLITIASSARHELFHAVQYAYDWKLPFNGGRAEELTSWFIEGTATAAESSGASMVRDTGTIMRPVDVPMVDTEYDYGTQDFWVHAGIEQGGGLAYLQKMLEHGLTPNRVADRIPLAALWWSWVKSQVMESKYPIYHDGLSACMVRDHDITFEFIPDNYPYLNKRITLFEPAATLTWPTQQRFASSVGLAALTAQVVKVTFAQPASGILIAVQRLGSDLPVTYKVYLDGESELIEGEPKCRRIADGCRNFSSGQPTVSIPAGGTVYIVVANDEVDPASPPFGYEVNIQPAEGLCRAPP